MTIQPFVLVELNEINFDYVRQYQLQGELPNLRTVMDRHGCQQTVSDNKFEEWEPWIQWVTAHTGCSFAEHGIFRLGDVVESNVPQVWEVLEAQGVTVGAVSPMNGANRLKQPAFFLPDPWTDTQVSAPGVIRRMHAAIVQTVNDNALGQLKLSSIWSLLLGAAIVIPPKRLGWYVRAIIRSRRERWWRALILDRLLADTFLWLARKRRPDFASLFLNVGAHIQHHYLFSSRVYEGPNRNPDWYVGAGCDPVLDVYRLYDKILGDVLKLFGKCRVVIVTALHQDPCEQIVYYWRLKDHAGFLRKLGIEPARVLPRMSRDFLVELGDPAVALRAAEILSAIVDDRGRPVFEEVDNRGASLFVSLTYPYPVKDDMTVSWPGGCVEKFGREVTFVAIKNAQHNGVGYLIDSQCDGASTSTPLPLTRLKSLVLDHFRLHVSEI